MTTQLVSIHGGHSGQFCNHAENNLEEIVQAYIEQEFSWVGITEHMPPVNDAFLYPEEIEAGLTAVTLQHRFSHYIHTCRQLQIKYAPYIKLFVGFEGESYSGTIPFIRQLITQFRPDYVVGSLHHVDDIPFDFSQAEYERAITAVNGIDSLYGRYFDQQHHMIDALRPQVVGHFDHIRRFDDDYLTRLQKPAIWSRILRNLQMIKKRGLILDYNVAALRKGQPEPSVCQPILETAVSMGIPLIPGDDSHGLATVGKNISKGIGILQAAGVDTNWTFPTG